MRHIRPDKANHSFLGKIMKKLLLPAVIVLSSALHIACQENKDIHSTDCVQELNLFASPSWNSLSSVFSFQEQGGKKYMIWDDSVALIRDNDLQWIAADSHEGYYQQFTHNCDCEQCHIGLSDYCLQSPCEKPQSVSYSLAPSTKEVQIPTKVIKTMAVPEDLWGKYTLLEDDKYASVSINITGPIIEIYPTTESYLSVEVLEQVAQHDYLIHLRTSYGTQYPFATQKGNWFGLLKLTPQLGAQCSVCDKCPAKKLLWTLSTVWSPYRDVAKDTAVFGDSTNVISVDFSKCNSTPIAPPAGLAGEWVSDKNDTWNFDFINGSTTPYDERKLNFLEVLSTQQDKTRMVFTYGVSHDAPADPNRYNSIYTNTLEASPKGNCWLVRHNLNTSGDFGLKPDTDLTSQDTLCHPATQLVPNLEADNQASGAANTGRLLIEDNNLNFTYNTTNSLFATIVSAQSSTPLESGIYFTNIIVRIEQNTTWNPYSDHIGKYTLLRLYWYPKGSGSSTQPYLNFMYTLAETAYADTPENLDTDAIKLNKSLRDLHYTLK